MEPSHNVQIAQELRPLLETRMILEQDIQRTIESAEQNGDIIEDQLTGRRLASLRVAGVTYWVEYSEQDGAYLVHDAYSHRMEVR